MKYASRKALMLMFILRVGFPLLVGGCAFAQIAPGSKLYIPPPEAQQTLTDGTKVVTTPGAAFNLVLQTEIFKQHVPVKLVEDSEMADYVVHWAAIPEEHKGKVRQAAPTAYGGVVSTGKELYTVSISVLDKDKQVVWAGDCDKKNLRDSAEKIARQLNDLMKHKK